MTDGAEHPISADDEGFERGMNRHRAAEQRAAVEEAAGRLANRGITVGADDDMETVVDLLDAVERFEGAVEAKGGDLMVDSAPATQPDDPRFVLPKQQAGEALTAYVDRVRTAASQLAQSAD